MHFQFWVEQVSPPWCQWGLSPVLTRVFVLSTWQMQLPQPHLCNQQLGQVISPGFSQCLFEPVEGCELPQCPVARSFTAGLQVV